MIDITNKDEFLKYWNSKSAEFTTLEKRQIYFLEDDIFDTFLLYKNSHHEFKKYNKAADFITSINGSLTPIPDVNMLAINDDMNMVGYIERLEKLFNGDWCIAYFGLHTVNAKIWDTARDFANLVYDNTEKKPTGRVDVDCFLGNYASTHTGIHIDYAHNFAFSLRNGKKMYTWKPDLHEVNKLKYPDYEPYKEKANIIVNSTDRICYFPYDHYHVAESKNATSLVVNIAFWEENDDVNSIFEQIKNNLYSGVDGLNYIKKLNFPNDNFMSGSVDLEHEYFDIYNYVAERLSNFQLKLRIIVYKLIKTTSMGLLVPRPIEKEGINSSFVIKDSKAILQWTVLDDMLIISSNGHCSCMKCHKDVECLLKKIVENDRIDISLYKQSDRIELINKLYAWGCLICTDG